MESKTGEPKGYSFGEEYSHCLSKLKQELKKRGMVINAKTITIVIKIAMEIVEASQVKGNEQKKLVEKIVRQVVVIAPISDEKEKLLLDMIDEGVVGEVIELVVSATKGELNVNAAEKAAAGCCISLLKTRKN